VFADAGDNDGVVKQLVSSSIKYPSGSAGTILQSMNPVGISLSWTEVSDGALSFTLDPSATIDLDEARTKELSGSFASL
jgi:hypothetical protein